MTYRLSRLCEEFRLSPSEVLDEQDRLPVGLLEEIVEARAYAATFHGYEQSQRTDGYEHPLLTLVKQIESELAQEEIAAREEAAHG
jgi:hypothetical protein